MARPLNPAEYTLSRLNRVIDLVELRLDQPLELDDLAREAAFSPYHFHRLFHRCYGETPRDFVRRRRLEQGALLLQYSPAQIIQISAQCGFATPDGFTRAFRQHFGVSAKSWREGGFYAWQRAYAPPPLVRQASTPREVRIQTLADTRVAYHRRIGPYGVGAGEQWAHISQWMAAHRLDACTRYGIGLDNPAVTPAHRCRYDLCVGLPGQFSPPPGTPVKIIPGGRYAVLSFDGPPGDSGEAWLWLLEHWLPQTGFKVERMLTFERYPAELPNPDADSQTCELCLALT